jgi:hypothetical protein
MKGEDITQILAQFFEFYEEIDLKMLIYSLIHFDN